MLRHHNDTQHLRQLPLRRLLYLREMTVRAGNDAARKVLDRLILARLEGMTPKD